MRTKLLFGIAVVLAMVAAACGSDAPEVDTGANARTIDEVVHWHMQSGNEGEVDGAEAALTIDDDGAALKIDTTNLKAGHAYTLWWVVINAPSACAESPCTPPDVLGNPDTKSQIAFATGKVVDGTEATFEATLPNGAMVGAWLEPTVGFDAPDTAEIHVVINDHGMAIDEYMPGMISTYRGGCTDESLPEAFPASAKSDGEAGPNACTLWQDAIFIQ